MLYKKLLNNIFPKRERVVTIHNYGIVWSVHQIQTKQKNTFWETTKDNPKNNAIGKVISKISVSVYNSNNHNELIRFELCISEQKKSVF